jgi:hypothetical protein
LNISTDIVYQIFYKKSRLPGIHFLLKRLPGIDEAAILAYLKVQMGTGGIAGTAASTNYLAFIDWYAAGDIPAV